MVWFRVGLVWCWVSMFLEEGCKRAGGMVSGGRQVNHKRAALDFVAELTGSCRAGGEIKGLDHHNDSSRMHADDLPVPMFGVDMNLRCTFWNR